jgi:hypothetical protein
LEEAMCAPESSIRNLERRPQSGTTAVTSISDLGAVLDQAETSTAVIAA